MHKRIFWTALAILTLIAVSGCGGGSGGSGNGGGGNGGGTGIEPPDTDSLATYDYVVTVVGSYSDFRELVWIALVLDMNDNPIEQCILRIGDDNVTLYEGFTPSMWIGPIASLPQGATVPVNCTIDGTHLTQDVKIPYVPTVNWPQTWDTTAQLDLTWSMGGYSNWQEIEAEGEWYDAANNSYHNEDRILPLSTTVRSATVPADWFGADEMVTETYIGLNETNWAANNNFVVLCSAYDSLEGGDWRIQSEQVALRTTLRILSLIGE